MKHQCYCEIWYEGDHQLSVQDSSVNDTDRHSFGWANFENRPAGTVEPGVGSHSQMSALMEITTRVGGAEMMMAEEEGQRLFVYYVVGKPDVAVANKMNADGEL